MPDRKKEQGTDLDARIMAALNDCTLWKGPRPEISNGLVAVRADELAKHLGESVRAVKERLAYLEAYGRVENAGGNLADPTPRWFATGR